MSFETVILVLTGTLTTVISGIFWGYAMLANRVFRKTENAESLSTIGLIQMQLNNPFFLLCMISSVILLPIAAFLSLNEGKMRLPLLVAAFVVYLLGVFIVSLIANKKIGKKLVGEDQTGLKKSWNVWHGIRTGSSIIVTVLVLTAFLSIFKFETNTGACLPIEETTCGYLEVNGVNMYYETHGQGESLVLLHGEFATGGMFYRILPELAKNRQVIIIEQQGHGHTADINRPLSFGQMAEDTAELLKRLGITKTDVFGYSGGGSVALELAIRHPEMVRSLVVASAIYDLNGYTPGTVDFLKNASPDGFPAIVRDSYTLVAPDPAGWSTLVTKSKAMLDNFNNILPTQLEAISVPSLVIAGDRDIIKPEHSQDLARLLRAKTVTVKGDHSSYIIGDAAELLTVLTAFLKEGNK